MIRLLFFMIMLGAFSPGRAEEFDARVIVVMDGDTVMLLRDGKRIKLRLANIDAPEADQAFGKASRQALADRVLKKQVHVNSMAVDAYGRMVGELSLDGQSVNEEQVSKGMAWEYSHYHRNKHYLELDKQARQARRGLWAQSEQAIEPEQWRKAHPKPGTLKTASSIKTNSACGKKHLCSQMKTCEEAKVYFLQCGVKSLDGNGDGVPCESLCAAGTAAFPTPRVN